MHREILTQEQKEVLPMLEEFRKDFILVGGTAIALHIGHRESIDFDLFSFEEFKNTVIRRRVNRWAIVDTTIANRLGELTFISNGVKVTFFHYPFTIKASCWLGKLIKLPDLITLAAMKAYALGNRAKWKDYVDLYFIMRDHHSIEEIIEKGEEVFGNDFNPKIFRTQLSYFDDVSYAEKVDFLPGFEVDEEEIKKKLVEYSLQ